jgi:hypothetical protein
MRGQNPKRTFNTTEYITRKYTINITQEPSPQVAEYGERAEFKVETDGLGEKDFQWIKDGVPIQGAHSQNLVISSVTQDDLGNYSVLVSNSFGAAMSKPARLTLKSPIRITSSVLLDSGYIKITGKAPRGSSVAIETSSDLTQWTNLFSIPVTTGQFYLNFDASSKEKEYFRVRLNE